MQQEPRDPARDQRLQCEQRRHAPPRLRIRSCAATARTLARSRSTAPFARHEYDFSRAIEGGETIIDGNDVDTAPRNLHSLESRRRLGSLRDLDGLHAALDANYVGTYFLDAANTATYPGHTVAELRASTGARPADLRAGAARRQSFRQALRRPRRLRFRQLPLLPGARTRGVPVRRLRHATERHDVAWLIYIVSGLLSLGFIVHCIKTGRNTIWVYVLVVLITLPVHRRRGLLRRGNPSRSC